MLEAYNDWQRQRRVRKEARGMVKDVRRAVRRHAHRIPKPIAAELTTEADTLDKAVVAGDHGGMADGMGRLDGLVEKHLSFAKKSTFREYADSIAVAVMIALFLRAFVVEAFKIPSGSMIPTMEVGDHIFVNKFVYGIRIPFTKVKLFTWRKPKRGEVIVFIYPQDPDKDFIKRIVGVEGDRIAVKRNTVYINGKAVARKRLPGTHKYWDFDEQHTRWTQKTAILYDEQVGGETFLTMDEVGPYVHHQDFPSPSSTKPCEFPVVSMLDDPADPDVCIVPPGHVFVMGDNRNNSHDSRYWGPVPFENIKGKALVVWWSSGEPVGVRWDRLGHVVE